MLRPLSGRVNASIQRHVRFDQKLAHSSVYPGGGNGRMRLFPATTLLLALLAAGCAGESSDGNTLTPGTGPSPVTPPPRQSTGQLSFSTTAPQGWSSIDIMVDGSYVGTLRRYVSSSTGNSSCSAVADARVVTTVTAGSHNYTAHANNGGRWSGSTSVSSGGCQEVVLTCPNGNCR
jgi:hypothetical protein